MEDLRTEQAFWTGNYVDNHVKEGLAWSKQKYNHQVINLPAKDKAEIARLLNPIIQDYVKRVTAKGIPGNQIIQVVGIGSVMLSVMNLHGTCINIRL